MPKPRFQARMPGRNATPRRAGSGAGRSLEGRGSSHATPPLTQALASPLNQAGRSVPGRRSLFPACTHIRFLCSQRRSQCSFYGSHSSSPISGLSFARYKDAAVRRNKKNGFHKMMFFKGMNLPCFLLQRTRAATKAARGQEPVRHLSSRSRKGRKWVAASQKQKETDND